MAYPQKLHPWVSKILVLHTPAPPCPSHPMPTHPHPTPHPPTQGTTLTCLGHAGFFANASLSSLSSFSPIGTNQKGTQGHISLTYISTLRSNSRQWGLARGKQQRPCSSSARHLRQQAGPAVVQNNPVRKRSPRVLNEGEQGNYPEHNITEKYLSLVKNRVRKDGSHDNDRPCFRRLAARCFDAKWWRGNVYWDVEKRDRRVISP